MGFAGFDWIFHNHLICSFHQAYKVKLDSFRFNVFPIVVKLRFMVKM